MKTNKKNGTVKAEGVFCGSQKFPQNVGNDDWADKRGEVWRQLGEQEERREEREDRREERENMRHMQMIVALTRSRQSPPPQVTISQTR